MYLPVPFCDISQVVRTGTYDSIVQVGTGRYVPVRTDMYQVYRIPDDGMYWYEPVRTLLDTRPYIHQHSGEYLELRLLRLLRKISIT